MSAALRRPELVSKLVVVDMPPISMPLSNDFQKYIKGMKEVEAADVQKQSEADQILQKYEANPGVRMFLLTNLKKHQGKYHWRVPVDTLGKALGNMGDFPADGVYEGPTLFITGGKSPYNKPFDTHPDDIKAMFPNSERVVIPDAGHWGKQTRTDLKKRLSYIPS